MDEYSQVISKYDRLCTDRDNHSFWAENITEATEDIKSLIVWQNFYAYLANSDHVFTDVWKESLGEQVDKDSPQNMITRNTIPRLCKTVMLHS